MLPTDEHDVSGPTGGSYVPPKKKDRTFTYLVVGVVLLVIAIAWATS